MDCVVDILAACRKAGVLSDAIRRIQAESTEHLKDYLQACKEIDKSWEGSMKSVAVINRWEIKQIEIELLFRELGL